MILIISSNFNFCKTEICFRFWRSFKQSKQISSCFCYYQYILLSTQLCTDALDYYFKFRSQDVVGYLESALNRQKKTVSRQFHAKETKIMDKAEGLLSKKIELCITIASDVNYCKSL